MVLIDRVGCSCLLLTSSLVGSMRSEETAVTD